MPGERPTLLPSEQMVSPDLHCFSGSAGGSSCPYRQIQHRSQGWPGRQTSQDIFFKVRRTTNPEISSRQIIINIINIIITLNVPPLIPDGDPNAFGSPSGINGGKFTKFLVLGMRQKTKNIIELKSPWCE